MERFEGGSQFRWIRNEPDGTRVVLRDAPRRELLLTAEDVGCTLQYQCRPSEPVDGQVRVWLRRRVMLGSQGCRPQLP